MGISGIVLGSALLALPAPPPDSAADSVTLRDGQVALGQVLEPAPPGKVGLLIRRAWVEENLPEWARRWEAAESAQVRLAVSQRRERLARWKRERVAIPGRPDPIAPWIESELERLKEDHPASEARLMGILVPRADVRSVAKRPRERARLLRQGWMMDLAGAETMALDDLKSALEGRGFAIRGDDLPSVESLLPLLPETDARWLSRRAATEVLHERSLRFVRYQGLVLPEGEPGAGADINSALSAVTALLKDNPGDPLADRQREAAARGRLGLVVTSLETAGDLSGVRVDSTLWVRSGGDRWAALISRNGAASAGEAGAPAQDRLAADPLIKEAFQVFESLGLGEVGDEARRKSLQVGAATQKALAGARSALDLELEALALPVSDAPKRPLAQEKP
jgi:hypothetical protein